MHDVARRAKRRWRRAFSVVLVATAVAAVSAGTTQAGPTKTPGGPQFTEAVAFDVSKPLSELAKQATGGKALPPATGKDTDREPAAVANGTLALFSPLAAITGTSALSTQLTSSAIPAPIANFEGLSNQDNFDVFGFRVNPPDPNGDVGPNHYVEMINLVFGVYDKAGNLLLGPVDTGTLWADFPIDDCTDPSGDPIVVYDQLVNRWILSQFTTRGDPEYYNCVAVSKTPDPTGVYYRYAFVTQPDTVDGGYFFPDYPKYGVWTDSYILTTRDFGNGDPIFQYGISVYGLEKSKMISGNPNARAVQFFLNSDDVALNLIGDGLLPADIDGTRRPRDHAPAPIVGTQDDGASYGAPSDALNVWEFDVQWNSKPDASLEFVGSLPTAAFDSIFPCAPTSRDCLPQPGIVNPAQYLDILSYRQRPTFRLAYRNFGMYESLVTNQSVEALPGVAGVRWYELRRVDGAYSIHQQGTYAPNDGVHRWMGSIAQDKDGNMAVGYSVVNATTVFPGIRYTGRLAGDPLGQMTLGEGTIINGSGVQLTTNSRWGDYTDMTVDPDGCTFWYVNEYYTAASQATSLAGWLTRIASFQLPGCS
jgi:hypothetical protein